MTNFKNTTYFKMGTGFDDPFTRVPNIILDERNLSAKAIGVYVKIIRFQNSTDHKIYIKSLATSLKDGVDAITSAVNELIEFGYIERERIRNEKGQLTGCIYTVHAKPIEKSTFKPTLENPISVNPTQDFTLHKKKISKKKISKKENNVVVVEEKTTNNSKNNKKENELIDLYKSFKIEKRVMPHTLKLLKDNSHIDLDVFNEIFISASEDSVNKKYAYIKEIIDRLNESNIITLEQFNQFNENYKEKRDKALSSNKSNQKSVSKSNKFNNFESTFDKYSEDELEQIIAKSQSAKFGSDVSKDIELNDLDKKQQELVKEDLNDLSIFLSNKK